MEAGGDLIFIGALAVVLVVWSFGIVRESRHPTGHDIRWFRMSAGLSLMLLAVAGGTYVLREQPAKLVEARGYGVVVEGVEPLKQRDFDVGLALAQSVRLASCDSDERADVTLQIAPTAEFWIDNLDKLTGRTRIKVLIPVAAARVEDVSQGAYGVDPFTKPVDRSSADDDRSGLAFTSRSSGGDVVAEVDVDDWSTERKPVRITYSAPLVRPRGLGTCYVDLPALTGLPTVISGASLEGLAGPSVAALEAGGRQGLFIVSGRSRDGEASQFAYYDPRFEVTRGVTTLELDNLTEEESQPTSDANFAGAPAWTCRSTVASQLLFLEDEAAKRQDETRHSNGRSREVLDSGDGDHKNPFFSTSRTDGGTYALSGDRIDEVLEQKDCAARVEIAAPSAGYGRDVLFLFVGALFSAGTGLLTGSVRRRRPGQSSAGVPTTGAFHPSGTRTSQLLTAMRRARKTSRKARRRRTGS